MTHPLQPQQVYVPVKMTDEMPEKEGVYFVTDDTSRWISSLHPNIPPSEWIRKKQSWLKEQSLYTFTREEIIDIVSEAWLKGNREGWAMITDWPEDGVLYARELIGEKCICEDDNKLTQALCPIHGKKDKPQNNQ